MKNNKRICAGLLAAVIAAACIPGVSAAMPAPTQPLSTEDGVIKCAGAGATGVMIEMLGGNLVGAAGVHLSTKNMPLFMPMFGTDGNQTPDPWLYNAFYNTEAATPVENASSTAFVGNGPGEVDTSTTVDNTIPLLVNRPDFILGDANSLSPYVDAINAGGETYQPVYGTGAGMKNPEQIMKTVSSYAEGMQSVIDQSGGKLKGRYGSPSEIATKFSDFYKRGIDTCTAKVQELKKDPVQTIVVTGESNGDWAVQDGTAEDIFNEYIKGAGGEAVGQKDGVMTTDELLAADFLLTRDPSLKTALASAFDEAGKSADEIPEIYRIPSGVYGWNLRSPEGALATPWLTSLFYPELAEAVNPVYTTAYFYSNYYHYTGNLEEVVGVVLTDNSLPEGFSTDLSAWDGSCAFASDTAVAVSGASSDATAQADTQAEESGLSTAAIICIVAGVAVVVAAAIVLILVVGKKKKKQ